MHDAVIFLPSKAVGLEPQILHSLVVKLIAVTKIKAATANLEKQNTLSPSLNTCRTTSQQQPELIV